MPHNSKFGTYRNLWINFFVAVLSSSEVIDNNESRNTRPCHHQDLRHNGRSSQGTPAFFVSPSTRLLFSNCFLVLFLSSFVSVAVCFLLSSSVSYISSYAWLCSCIFPMFVCLYAMLRVPVSCVSRPSSTFQLISILSQKKINKLCFVI